MTIYFVIYFLIAGIASFDILCVRKYQRYIIMIFLWLFLTLFAGLRYNNADWGQYVLMFEEAISTPEFTSVDIGFDFISKFLGLFTNSPLSLFLFYAATATALNLESFKKYSPYFLICILFYFVHHYVLKEMIQIRAGLASAICLYSIRFLSENKYKKFFFVWIIAVTIHLSAVIWGITWFCHRYKMTFKWVNYLVIFSLIIGIVCPFGNLIKLFANGIDERLTAYIAYGDEGYAGTLGIFTNINTLKSMFVFLIISLYYKKLESSSKYFVPIYYAYAAGLSWLMIFNDFAIIGARMSSILFSVEPIVISYIYSLMSYKSRPVFYVILIGITLAMLLVNMGPNKITEYNFYFS